MIDEGAERKPTSLSLKWNLSALALIASAGGAGVAAAATPDEAGGGITVDVQGQYNLSDNHDLSTFGDTGPFLLQDNPTLHPGTGYDLAGTVSYQAPGSDLSYSVGVRYGRTNTSGKSFHTAYDTKYSFSRSGRASHTQEHLFVDFNVGKDVGMGIWGPGVSTVGGGIRYAHLSSLTRGSFATSSKYISRAGSFRINRRNDAVGPRIFVQQTSFLPGSMGQSGFSIGWGGGVGVLFGRQTVSAINTFTEDEGSLYNAFPGGSRSHNVTSPDVDAFFQLGFTPPHTGLTIGAGYRFEEVFNALDGGYSVRSQQDFVQQGPYVDVSIHFK